MLGRLLSKAAVLLAALLGPAAMANEPGTGQNNFTDAQDFVLEVSGIPDATLPINVGRNPRIVVMTDDSATCKSELARLGRAGGAFDALIGQGWKIGAGPENHIQIVDRHTVASLAAQLTPAEFPVVACLSDGELVRSFKDGCSTPLDAWTFGWLLKGVNERPQAPIPEAIRVATTGHYPLRGNHWTVDGDSNPTKETLVSHLRGANHVVYLNADWKIEEWSTEELRSLHDDLHEKYGPAAPANPAGSASRPSSSSFDQFSGSRKALGKF